MGLPIDEVDELNSIYLAESISEGGEAQYCAEWHVRSHVSNRARDWLTANSNTNTNSYAKARTGNRIGNNVAAVELLQAVSIA
jgi:hypothetical protein